jgi:hypothetical protein
MSALAAAALSIAGLGAAVETSTAPAKLWHESDTPHFQVYYEAKLPPAGFSLALEKMHSRMRLELSSFAPWMDTEKVDVFLFASSATYAAGPFHPPPWSNGLSLPERRMVIVYERPDSEGLKRVLAHETTHVLFESYFRGSGVSPPTWINEGLAMAMETPQSWSDQDERKSPWHQRLFEGGKIRFIPMRKFLAISPDKERTDKDVNDWYLQAYAATRFLLREHSRIQFRLLCQKLKSGLSTEQALSDVYHYHTVDEFERAYLAWMKGGKSDNRFSPTSIEPTHIRFR